MSARCPNGHDSESSDYCDTCGAPIVASATGSANAAGDVAGAGPVAAAGAGSGGSGGVGSAGAAGAAGAEVGSGGGNSLDLPPAGLASVEGSAAPAASGSGAAPGLGGSAPKPCPHCSTANAPQALFCEGCGYDFTTGALPATLDSAGAAGSVGAAGSGDPGAAQPGPGASGSGIPPRIPFHWVAEVWIDPDWYADQAASDPLPSAGLPIVVPLRVASVLIGRRSASRSITPDIDCSADPGVSRRHAQLTTDGSRWFVEDLQSSNGTYVGAAAGPLPEAPIAVGPKAEVGESRIYVGAWTRIVVRRALDEEIARE